MKTHSVSQAGLDLIKTFEGFRAEPVALHDGGWVVGYSHVRIAEAGEPVTEEEAAAMLPLDLAPFERFVNAKVISDINQSQFDALVSFCFSVGAAAFEKSDVLRKVNAGQFVPAACAMDAWRKSSVGGESEVFDHLIRRRAAEKAMFLKEPPVEGAPSVYFRAELDHAASILGAPIAYGEMPPIGAAPKIKTEIAPIAHEDAQKIVSILKAETQTALVLTQVLDDDADEGEIVTAHARPVARQIAPAARRIRFAPPAMRAPVETVALGALFAFGVGLVALAAVTMFGGRAEPGDLFAGLALAAPGVGAAVAALYGLWKGPAPRAA